MAGDQVQVGSGDSGSAGRAGADVQLAEEAGGARSLRRERPERAERGQPARDLRDHAYVRQARAEGRAHPAGADVPPRAQLPLDRRGGRAAEDRPGHPVPGDQRSDLHPSVRGDPAELQARQDRPELEEAARRRATKRGAKMAQGES